MSRRGAPRGERQRKPPEITEALERWAGRGLTPVLIIHYSDAPAPAIAAPAFVDALAAALHDVAYRNTARRWGTVGDLARRRWRQKAERVLHAALLRYDYRKFVRETFPPYADDPAPTGGASEPAP